MTVSALHVNRGYESLRFVRKGGELRALAVNPQTAQRIRAYVETAGHMEDREGPSFAPCGRIRRPRTPGASLTRTPSTGSFESTQGRPSEQLGATQRTR